MSAVTAAAAEFAAAWTLRHHGGDPGASELLADLRAMFSAPEDHAEVMRAIAAGDAQAEILLAFAVVALNLSRADAQYSALAEEIKDGKS